MDVINRIIDLAKSKGISQAYLCSKIGMRRTYLGEVRNGHDRLTDDRINKIADILDTTPAYLRGETDEKEKPALETLSDSELDDEFMRLYDLLSPDEKDMIRASIQGIINAKKNQN